MLTELRASARPRPRHPDETRRRIALAAVALLHAIALIVILRTESGLVAVLAALFSWGFFNASWIALLSRPVMAAALALASLILLIVLSRLKHEILLMTVNFVDLLLIDSDTIAFLLQVFPNLDLKVAAATAIAAGLLALLWRYDPLRLPRAPAAAAAAVCFAGLAGLSLYVPSDPWAEFYEENYFSKFMRSSITVTNDLVTRGMLDQDRAVTERLATPAAPCTVETPPHIILIHDESSFDARVLPGVKTPAGYGAYFKSGDGRQRTLLVEGAGGPSWYTEYNIVTGLSARSFGRFADFVTRVAAGRVKRGLGQNLKACGYKTFTLYPMYGTFMSARTFQTEAGIDHFLDARALGAKFQDTDAFYFNAAADRIASERRDGNAGPMFMLVYTAQNHFPWTFRFRPDLATDWQAPGNRADVDEYLRRQHLTAVDYHAFKQRLERDFPRERFLIVRFGDHQPYFARNLIDPGQDDSMIVRSIAAADPRFLATYYSIEGINFTPRETGSAIDRLDAPYLPLVVLESAGVPLDPSFAEQRKLLERCKGLFYRCEGGREARRFNRLLINAGLIKGL